MLFSSAYLYMLVKPDIFIRDNLKQLLDLLANYNLKIIAFKFSKLTESMYVAMYLDEFISDLDFWSINKAAYNFGPVLGLLCMSETKNSSLLDSCSISLKDEIDNTLSECYTNLTDIKHTKLLAKFPKIPLVMHLQAILQNINTKRKVISSLDFFWELLKQLSVFYVGLEKYILETSVLYPTSYEKLGQEKIGYINTLTGEKIL